MSCSYNGSKPRGSLASIDLGPTEHQSSTYDIELQFHLENWYNFLYFIIISRPEQRGWGGRTIGMGLRSGEVYFSGLRVKGKKSLKGCTCIYTHVGYTTSKNT